MCNTKSFVVVVRMSVGPLRLLSPQLVPPSDLSEKESESSLASSGQIADIQW